MNRPLAGLRTGILCAWQRPALLQLPWPPAAGICGAMCDPQAEAAFAHNGLQPQPNSQAQFRERVAGESPRNKEAVAAVGIRTNSTLPRLVGHGACLPFPAAARGRHLRSTI